MKTNPRSSLAAMATLAAVLLAVPTTASAQTFTTLHDFTGAPTARDFSVGVTLSGGKLYGATVMGGSSGGGILFSLNSDGSGFTNLHSLTASEGRSAGTGVIVSGNTLYGSAVLGGNGNSGTVFAFTTSGTGLTVLHHFAPLPPGSDAPSNSEGAAPSALILSGNTLYGTASEGGRWGFGTVFKLNTNGGGFTNLHDFPALQPRFPGFTNSEGANPRALTLSGNTLYGTTTRGGIADGGTLFSVNTDGTGFTNLHKFTEPIPSPSTFSNTNSDGSRPSSKLAISGNTVFGTAMEGGAFGRGTVFSVHTDGTGFRVLHHFSRPAGSPFSTVNSDGVSPINLVLWGNVLLGATGNGGSMGWGTIFAVNLDGGNFRTLFNFSQANRVRVFDSFPSDDTLYGVGTVRTTNDLANYGTVFSLSLLVPPRLSLIRSGGSVVLSWPADALGFTLQSTTDLVPPAVWDPVPSAPVLVGGRHTVTDPITGPRKFYRLGE